MPKLSVRQREADPRATPAGLEFSFDSPTKITIKRPDGFDAGAIYEFIYTAKDPKVMGLGFAATRDIVSFLHNETADAAGTANPLSGGSTAPSASALRRAAAICTTISISASMPTRPAAWCSTG